MEITEIVLIFFVLFMLFVTTDLNPLLMWRPYALLLGCMRDKYPMIWLALFILACVIGGGLVEIHEARLVSSN